MTIFFLVRHSWSLSRRTFYPNYYTVQLFHTMDHLMDISISRLRMRLPIRLVNHAGLCSTFSLIYNYWYFFWKCFFVFSISCCCMYDGLFFVGENFYHPKRHRRNVWKMNNYVSLGTKIFLLHIIIDIFGFSFILLLYNISNKTMSHSFSSVKRMSEMFLKY